MKSKIRIDVDFDNNPVMLITNYGSPHYSNQDLRDKMLARYLENTIYLEVNHRSGGSDEILGGYIDYELYPVKESDVIRFDGFPKDFKARRTDEFGQDIKVILPKQYLQNINDPEEFMEQLENFLERLTLKHAK